MKVEEFVDPYLNRTWGELGARILTSGNQVAVTLGYPADGVQEKLAGDHARFLGVDAIDLEPVSYTHLTLPTILLSRSRWSPYH